MERLGGPALCGAMSGARGLRSRWATGPGKVTSYFGVLLIGECFGPYLSLVDTVSSAWDEYTSSYQTRVFKCW